MNDPKIPAHRTAPIERSGETHVIGDDGERRNLDAEARELAEREQAVLRDAPSTLRQAQGSVAPQDERAKPKPTSPRAAAAE